MALHAHVCPPPPSPPLAQVGDDASKLPKAVVFAAYMCRGAHAREDAFKAVVASACSSALEAPSAAAAARGGGRRRVLVFTDRKEEARELAALPVPGVRMAALTGDLSQGQRERALEDFKGGRVDVICATDGACVCAAPAAPCTHHLPHAFVQWRRGGLTSQRSTR